MIKFKAIQHDVKQLFPKLPQVFESHPEVVAAYLFGSYASDEVGPLSDVDIAYLFAPRFFQAQDYLTLNLRIGAELSIALQTDEVDCKLLNKAPLDFQYEVITSGKLIYSRNLSLLGRYEQQVKRAYEQRRHEFEVTKQDLLQAFKS